MSECKQCPHVVGDTYQRDCAFPDCIGGWEEAYKQQVKKVQEQLQKVADWAMSQGLATGHADTLDDLLLELTSQMNESKDFNHNFIRDRFKLTRQEYKVLLELCTENSRQQIADSMNIALETVHTHCSNLYRKLGCSTRHSVCMKYLKLTPQMDETAIGEHTPNTPVFLKKQSE